jgi:UDP:flavonoid glycosyltransferase YjiC (YdhE family)
MRVLFTARAGFGHFHPLVPLAQAARDTGHDAAFAMPPSFQSTVERLGFRWWSAGLDLSSPEYARFIRERNQLPSRERAIFMRRGSVTLLGPRMTVDLLRISEAWLPDVIVRDASDFGGCVAAEVLGIPHAAHYGAAFLPWMLPILAEPLAALRDTYGLPPDPELHMLERYLVLSPFPPTLEAAGTLARPTLHIYRAMPFDRSGDEQAPDWPLAIPDAPLVYATLGTAVNVNTDILRAFVEALRDEPVNLVVTVGRNGDPSQFGPQPPNVRIEQYIPQSQLFPRCDLVISHGGSNTMLAAAAHGIPQLMVPITADQPDNAERCAAAGVARIVPLGEANAVSIRQAALMVLSDPSYRVAANRLRDEIAGLPGIDQAVALLERLARDKTPLIATLGVKVHP